MLRTATKWPFTDDEFEKKLVQAICDDVQLRYESG